MAANASAHSDLVTLHKNLHALLIKFSLSLHLTSPSPSPPYNPTHHLTTTPNRLSTHRPTPSNSPYKNNPNDPLEVLYTLSPPAFHYLPRSTLLPPQILRKGFIETAENNPPLLSGTRMQIMVIHRRVRKIVVHFLVYDPVRKETRRDTKISPLSSTSSSSAASRDKKEIPNKLRKKASRILNPQPRIRDFPTKRRSTSRFANANRDVNADADANGRASCNLSMNQSQKLDEMEIEVMEKRQVSEIDAEREEDREGEYVVMRRVVKLPRKVWCGRNCKDKFEQLFIRRT